MLGQKKLHMVPWHPKKTYPKYFYVLWKLQLQSTNMLSTKWQGDTTFFYGRHERCTML